MEQLAKHGLRGVFHEDAFYADVVARAVPAAPSDAARELVATRIYADVAVVGLA